MKKIESYEFQWFIEKKVFNLYYKEFIDINLYNFCFFELGYFELSLINESLRLDLNINFKFKKNLKYYITYFKLKLIKKKEGK